MTFCESSYLCTFCLLAEYPLVEFNLQWVGMCSNTVSNGNCKKNAMYIC